MKQYETTLELYLPFLQLFFIFSLVLFCFTFYYTPFSLLSHWRSSIYVSPSTAQARLTLCSLSEQYEGHIAFPRIIFFSSLFTPTHHIPPPPHSLSMFFSPRILSTLCPSPFFSLTYFFLSFFFFFFSYFSFIATLSPSIPFW
jgi:hypothetical protein